MAKQLFNTTEKSNFILNLTEEQYSKLASRGLAATILLSSITTAIPVLSGIKMYSLSSVGVTVGGVLCMILALIGGIKKYVSKKIAVPAAAMGFSLLWAIISMVNSYDVLISINGYPGRGEGVLAIMFYGCIFLTASCIKTEKARKDLLWGILANGLLNSFVGIVQIFTGEISDFSKVSLKIEINAASGFSQSPIFLAMVLSISIVAAICGLIFFEGKKSKVICGVSICLFSFVNMFTYSLVGICGTALAAVAGIIILLAAKAPKKNLLSILGIIVPAAAAVVIVNCGVIGNIDSYRLYDGRILWFADSYMRLNASGEADSNLVDIDDTADVYYYMSRKTNDLISKYGLVGTGPDQLVYPQLYNFGLMEADAVYVEDIAGLNKGTFDRMYNEYLNTAATRGIPSAIAFAVSIIGAFAVGVLNYRKTKNKLTLGLVLITVMGGLLFIICCSSTAFTPIFWAIAGCSTINPESKAKKTKK